MHRTSPVAHRHMSRIRNERTYRKQVNVTLDIFVCSQGSLYSSRRNTLDSGPFIIILLRIEYLTKIFINCLKFATILIFVFRQIILNYCIHICNCANAICNFVFIFTILIVNKYNVYIKLRLGLYFSVH